MASHVKHLDIGVVGVHSGNEGTFLAAQQSLAHRKSDDYLLDCLRSLLVKEHSLGRHELRTTRGMPCEETYVQRFGSLRKAFALVGFERRDMAKAYETVNRLKRLRSELVQHLLNRFANKVHLQQASRHFRPILCFDNSNPLLVLVCKSIILRNGQQRWELPPHIKWNGAVLLCRCDPENTRFEKFSIFVRLPPGRSSFKKEDFHSRKCGSAIDVCSLFGSKRIYKLLHLT